MKLFSKVAAVTACLLVFGVNASAQSASVKAEVTDSSTGDPVSFATVSLTQKGAKSAYKYGLTSESGALKIDGVKAGSYVLKVELMGYKALSLEINVGREALELGKLKMESDTQVLDAATVTAVGNPILIKKDTIEYNAAAYKTTENDVLEDLLKKLPGVEVAEDGSITVNGETIKKITIDGKTFFLDDPQLASKNIPAKIVNKLKVVQKKSDQAAFTGIDDGEEETIIDLNIKKGMMKGLFGNIMAGAGHDIPSSSNTMNDWRFQGAGFLGRFKDKSQISVILNANNTNDRAFNDLAGSMMGNIRGGGGGYGRGGGGWGPSNGITTSYMGGVNGVWDLFDDNMELGGNYLYSRTDKSVLEESLKTTYLEDRNLLYNSSGSNNTVNDGHRFGIRLEHKFSENTSILFEPQVNFGYGHYSQDSRDSTYNDFLDGEPSLRLNRASTLNSGRNRNVSTSGFFLLRQRLGIPGRTLTAFARYSFSNNELLDGRNWSSTQTYDDAGEYIIRDSTIDQNFTSKAQSTSLMGRLTYTEPLGNHFYLEANYMYSWNRSLSNKTTIDNITGEQDYTYSNRVENRNSNHEIGVNALFQTEKVRAQLGFAALPTTTWNSTTRWDPFNRKYEPMEYDPGTRWFFSPQAMLWWEMGESANARMFYRGRAGQPSTSQLMPVPDNTNPLSVSFGNPTLTPYFTHTIRGDVRYNDKKSFTSFNIRFNGGVVENPVVSANWYGTDGVQYTMPFNGKNSANAGFNAFLNLPIARSNFSISNFLRANWSMSSSYIGSDIDMDIYQKQGFYAFMEQFVKDFNDPEYFAEHIKRNDMNNLSVTERLSATFRTDYLEVVLSGRTRVNRSWYTISTSASNRATWNNQVRTSANWTIDSWGLTLKSEFSYNWYNGYSTAKESEYILDAEIQKLLFKKKLTLALKCYDILGQAKNLNVSDSANYHTETLNNTLGRYIVLSLTYRFGTFNRSEMRGPGGMRGGPGGRPPRM